MHKQKKSKTEEMLADIIPETRKAKRKSNAVKANSLKASISRPKSKNQAKHKSNVKKTIAKKAIKKSKLNVNPKISFELAAKKALALKHEIKSGKSNEKADSKNENKVLSFDFKSTAEIPVSKQMIGQVIGQEKGVEIIKKAAIQKRNILLVGLPGTGKSMLAQAMAELMPVSKLHDILVYPNSQDPNNPKIRIVESGKGKEILAQAKMESKAEDDNINLLSFLLPFGFFIIATVMYLYFGMHVIIYAACLLLGGIMMIAFSVSSQMKMRSGKMTPKLLIDNAEKKMAPFLEATGARAGALLGDVRHDPLQCFYGFNKLCLQKGGGKSLRLIKKPFAELWDEMQIKYGLEIIRNKQNHEAIMLPSKEKIYALGYKNNKVVLSRILSLNRQSFDGELIEIKSGKNKIFLTPEHKIITEKQDKSADRINYDDKLFKINFVAS